VDGDVYDSAACFFDLRTKICEILRIQRAEMLAPRFDLVDIEFRFDVSQEILQIHLRRGRFVIFVVSARDEISEGIGSDGNSFAGRRRKLERRDGARGKDPLQARPQQSRGCGCTGLRKKISSGGGWQNGASLTE